MVVATKVAAFDLDGTITDRDCVVPFLRDVVGTPMLTLGLMTRPVAAFSALIHRDRDEMKAAAARAAFAGREVAAVEQIAHRFADRVNAHWLRPAAIEQVEQHRRNGDSIVIVSASFAIYVEPLARLLAIDHVLATRLAVSADGRFTGALDGLNCRGVEKVRRLHGWLDETHGGRGAVELTAYGDSPGDRELLDDADVSHWVGTNWTSAR